MVAAVHRNRQIQRQSGDTADAGRAQRVEVRRRAEEEARHVLVLFRIQVVLELEAAAPFGRQGCLTAQQVDRDVLRVFPLQVERRHAAARPRGAWVQQERGQRVNGRLRRQVRQRHGGDRRFPFRAFRRVAGDAADGMKEPSSPLDRGLETVDGELAEGAGGDRPVCRTAPRLGSPGVDRPRPAVSEVADQRAHDVFAVVRLERVENVRHRRAGLLFVRRQQIVRKPSAGGALGNAVEVGRRSDRDALGNRGGRRVARKALQFAEQDLAQRGLVRRAGEAEVLVAGDDRRCRRVRRLGLGRLAQRRNAERGQDCYAPDRADGADNLHSVDGDHHTGALQSLKPQGDNPVLTGCAGVPAGCRRRRPG